MATEPQLTVCAPSFISVSLSLSPNPSKVDQEIVGVIQDRMKACQQREGDSAVQNCIKEIKDFNDTTRAYLSRCK